MHAWVGCSLRVRRRSAAPTPGLLLSCFPPAQLNSVGNVKEDSIAERDGMGGGDPIIPTCLRARARLTCSCLGRVIAPFGLTRAQRAGTCKHEGRRQGSAWPPLTRAGPVVRRVVMVSLRKAQIGSGCAGDQIPRTPGG